MSCFGNQASADDCRLELWGLSDSVEQFGYRDAQAVRDLVQARKRNVRLSKFNVAHVRPIQSAPMGKFLLAPSLLFAQVADSLPKFKE